MATKETLAKAPAPDRRANSRRYEPPIQFERLDVMIAELNSARALSIEMRAEIALALDCLGLTFILEKRDRTRGRRINHGVRMAAYIVDALVRRHECSIKAAACAVLPNAKAKEIEALQRMYRTCKRSDLFAKMSVHEDTIERAANRLLPRMGSANTAKALRGKGGNK